MIDFLNHSLHNGMILMIAVLLLLAIAYRYYSAFIAAKVLALDDARPTPAHTLKDDQNYEPTNKWVLFGHHFAAISGAGPLIGPVLAAQYGFLPGLLWILIGVCLAGAVQDFIVLGLSIRRGGKSLAQIAYLEAGPVAGAAATLGILFVLIIALAGLGKVVVKALGSHVEHYPVGTQFLAPPHATILEKDRYSNVLVYRIPEGSRLLYPAAPGKPSVEVPIDTQITIEAQPTDDRDYAVSLDPALTSDAMQPTARPGQSLVVLPGTEARLAVPGSAWGTFTIAMTIPIALLIGLYMKRFRPGRVVEASILGGLLVLAAVYFGGSIDSPDSLLHTFRDNFDLSEPAITLAMAIYGFVASILPVSILLLPRDYLSSFLKIGTVALLVLGVILARPELQAPAINHAFLAGGPIVKGSIFPFVFITIMCGAISGFHALVSSGTTPKMLNKESDARTIGYGAMLLEGLVGIVALIAATSLPSGQFYAMNTASADVPTYQHTIADLAAHDLPSPGQSEPQPLSAVEASVGENLHGRTGGGVTLAVGMAKIFDDAARKLLGSASSSVAWLESMMKYWYHFAIMFEALFILTTIDAGTRVGRFLLQETLGKWVHPSLGKTASLPSSLLATALIVAGWYYFITATAMDAIWPMFGIANQMLAVIALAIATTALLHNGKRRYIWITLTPMAFVILTTGSAAVLLLQRYFTQIKAAPTPNPIIASTLILAITACTAIILIASLLATRHGLED